MEDARFYIGGKPAEAEPAHAYQHERWAAGPLEALEVYEQAGYDAVAITDHRTLTLAPDYRGEMLLLNGMEWDVNLRRGGETIHLLGIGVGVDFHYSRQEENDAQGFIDAVEAGGGLSFFCHPHWSMNRVETILGLRGLAGAEVFNSVSRPPQGVDRADAGFFLDVAASEGCLLPTIAVDDSHAYVHEIFGGFIYLNAGKDEKSILMALQAGAYYASRGPRILSCDVDNGVVNVTTSPVRHITFHSNLPWTPKRCVSGEALTRASYQVCHDRGERFIRVVVIDEGGRKAWLNPFAV
ncbi:MAG: PHP domain-containing protein [Christensenellales bacterium]